MTLDERTGLASARAVAYPPGARAHEDQGWNQAARLAGRGLEDPGAGGRKTADPQTGHRDNGDGDATACPESRGGGMPRECSEHCRYRGRLASIRTLVLGVAPIGQFLIGATAERVGTHIALAAAGLLCATLMTALTLLAPPLRRL